MASNPRPRRPWEEGSDTLGLTQATPASIEIAETGDSRPKQGGARSIGHGAHSRPSINHIHVDRQAYDLAHWSRTVQNAAEHTSDIFSNSKRRRTEDYVLSGTIDATDHANQQDYYVTHLDRSSSTKAQAICCLPGCAGPQCSSIRTLASEISDDLTMHEKLTHGPPTEESKAGEETIDTPLTLLLLAVRSRLKDSNGSLQLLVDTLDKQGTINSRSSSQPQKASSSSISNMSTTASNSSAVPSARAQLLNPSMRLESPQAHNTYLHASRSGADVSNMSSTASNCASNASGIPHNIASGTLSQSSANAQNEVLQELTHQLSVKSLSHSALAREYDMLLQKLSRQRVKCAALERKFEVSDAEIVSLSTDKERLEDRIECLEHHSHELQKQRDEARKASEESKAQWMTIVTMAGKLHGASNAGKSTEQSPTEQEWVKQRAALLKQIAQLEADASGEIPLDEAVKARITRLEEENTKLRQRNTKLENGLSAAKAAVVTLAAHGQKVGTVLERALDE